MREYKIGRNADADIILTTTFCSRDHAKITISDDNRILLQDYSSNGTLVKGKKIENQTVEIKYGDEVLFGNVEKLDWSKIERPIIPSVIHKEESPAAPASKEVPQPPNGNSPLIFGIIAVLALAALAFIFYTKKSSTSTETTVNPSEIYTRYQSAVALVEVEYYIKIHTIGTDVYLGMNDSNEIDLKISKDALKPFTSEGTAFYVDSNGTLVTNHHVVEPWKYNKVLKNYFNTQIKPAIMRLYKERGYGNQMPTYFGERVGIYIYPNGSQYNKSYRVPCTVYKVSNNEEIDLASIETNNKNLPAGAIIISRDNIETDPKKIEVNKSAYLIGFPYGDELAVNEDHTVNCSSTQGSFTQAPSTSYVQYSAASASGASGSPVFNQYGKLVAVNYLGMTSGQSFNRGILAKYIESIR